MSRPARVPTDLVDWSELRRRLAEALARTEAAEVLTPERARELMEERARRLAQEPAPLSAAGETIEVLRFALGAERYAIEARFVREVVRLTDFTPVPGAGELVLGVTNLRGEVLCVVDLRQLFSVQQHALNDLSRILVLGVDSAEFGILADDVYEIGPLQSSAIRSSSTSLTGIERTYLRGVTDDALIVLDGAVLLRDPCLFIDQSEGSAT